MLALGNGPTIADEVGTGGSRTKRRRQQSLPKTGALQQAILTSASSPFQNEEKVSTERTADAQAAEIVNKSGLTDMHAPRQAMAGTQALAANHGKIDFISSMGHELRTPLNAILGFAQLLESGSPAPTAPQKRSIDQILHAGWSMLEMIDERMDPALMEMNLSAAPRPAEGESEDAARTQPHVGAVDVDRT